MLQFLLGFLVGGLVFVLVYRRLLEPSSSSTTGKGDGPPSLVVHPPRTTNGDAIHIDVDDGHHDDARSGSSSSSAVSTKERKHGKSSKTPSKHPKKSGLSASSSSSKKDRSKRLSGSGGGLSGARSSGASAASSPSSSSSSSKRQRSSNSFKTSRSIGEDKSKASRRVGVGRPRSPTPELFSRSQSHSSLALPSRTTANSTSPVMGGASATEKSHSLSGGSDEPHSSSRDPHSPGGGGGGAAAFVGSGGSSSPGGGPTSSPSHPFGSSSSSLACRSSLTVVRKRGHRRNGSLSAAIGLGGGGRGGDGEDLDDICRRFSDREFGVRLKQIDRKLRAGKIRVQKYVFSGAEGVNWLVQCVEGVNTREAAIHLGLSMWAKGYFRHVKHPHRPFCDEKNEYFRFSRDEKHASAKERLRESLLAQHLTPVDDHEAQSADHMREWLNTISGWVQISCRKEKGSDKADWERFWCKFSQDEAGAWNLCLYTDIEDTDVIQLVVAMHDSETGIRYHKRDRLSRKSIISDKVCFQGRSAVKWCLNTGKTTNRMEAVNIMTSLLSKGIISPLDADEFGPFQDKKDTLYYFTKFAEGKRWKRALGDGNRKVVGKTLDTLTHQPAALVGTLDFSSGGAGDLLLKLEKSRGKIQVVLFLDPPAPLAFSDAGAERLLVDPNVFKIQLREKDDLRVKNWVFAFQMCVLLSSPAYVHEIDTTYVPTDDSDTDNSDMVENTDDTDDEDGFRSSSGSGGEDEQQQQHHHHHHHRHHHHHHHRSAPAEDAPPDQHPAEGDDGGNLIDDGDDDDGGDHGDGDASVVRDKSSHGGGGGGKGSGERKKRKKKKGKRKKKKKWAAKSDLLNAAEKAVLVEMKRKIAEEKEAGVYEETGHDLTLVSDRELVKYLRARRLDVDMGLQLLKNGVAYRAEHGLESIKVTEIFQEIHGDNGGAMVSTDPTARDRDGRMIFIVFTEHYNSKKTSGYDIVRAIYYLIESVYDEDEETERNGFTLIVDCKNSKYSNFDARMPGQVINGIVGKFPGRVGHVFLINTPWYFKFVWRIIKSLLSAYLVQKFHILAKVEEIQEWVSPENLLPEHGGTADYDFTTWIRKRFEHDGVDFEDFMAQRGLSA